MATRYLLKIDSKPKIHEFRYAATLPEIVAGLETNKDYPAPFGPMFGTLAARIRGGASSGAYFTNLKGRGERWTWSIVLAPEEGVAAPVEKYDDDDEDEYDEDDDEDEDELVKQDEGAKT